MKALRLSTLAEVRVLSLTTAIQGDLETVTNARIISALEALRSQLEGGPNTLQQNRDLQSSLFKTVGVARSVRIDEDYGSTNIYGIGAPTRPRIVPNNYSVNATIERLQLDTRDLNHYVARPDYWYSDNVQRHIGIDDVLLYTFLVLRSKEDAGPNFATRRDIYALMPRSSQRAAASNDVMIAHNVSMVGFRYSWDQMYFDISNLVNESITDRITSAANQGQSVGSGGGGVM